MAPIPNLLAQIPVNIGGPIEGIGPLGTGLSTPEAANTQFSAIISTIIGTLTVGAGIWFIFQVFIGAVSWIGAGSDKAQLQTAQKRLTSAVIGLVVVVAAMVVIAVVGSILNFDILNFNIVNLVP